MSLTQEIRTQYVRIIDDILASADLNTISEKKIRKGIQDVVKHDITPHKSAIKELILQRFDVFNARENGSTPTGDPAPAPVKPSRPLTPPTTNGYSHNSISPSKSPPRRQSESEEMSDIADRGPPKKKRKGESVDADALMAARLQAEENARARPTRGGVSRKAAPLKKKATKKKISKSNDDSDMSDSDVAEKPERNTGFHKPLLLSPALSALLDGESMLSRPQTVKRLWKHIKANDLQDPKDKRQIICDEQMRAVFKQEKVHMFTMTKILNQNLYTPDE